MRWTTVATSSAGLVAALMTACAASTTPPEASGRLGSVAQLTSISPAPSRESCYAFAVSALRRRVVVRHRPPACAGLPQLQVNQDVARAIRTVVGSHSKAVTRQLSVALSPYLASLVRSVPPPPAVTIQVATTPSSSGELALRFSALASWLAAALVGAYLLAGRLIRGRGRLIRRPRAVPVVPLIHAGLAISGLLIWIAFTITSVAALAWADVGLTWVIAGLGMATLLGGLDHSSSRTGSAAPGASAGTTAAAFPSQAPVIVIALHGALATLTILLVLLAAVGIG